VADVLDGFYLVVLDEELLEVYEGVEVFELFYFVLVEQRVPS